MTLISTPVGEDLLDAWFESAMCCVYDESVTGDSRTRGARKRPREAAVEAITIAST